MPSVLHVFGIFTQFSILPLFDNNNLWLLLKQKKHFHHLLNCNCTLYFARKVTAGGVFKRSVVKFIHLHLNNTSQRESVTSRKVDCKFLSHSIIPEKNLEPCFVETGVPK